MNHIRCSSLAAIMTNPKTGDGLSVGAKTYLNQLAKEFEYSYIEVISGKEFEKGEACEDDLIDLYNDVFFTDYKKNTERKTNQWITGEADIVVPATKIIDMKNAFSLATFPECEEDVIAIAKKSGYDWQGRGYMMLWDIDLFEIAYGLVSTPDDLMKPWYQTDLHQVDHIDPARRITRTFIERDKSLEELIKYKVDLSRNYIQDRLAQIRLDHKHDDIRKAA
jgi:hypothetical protein